MIIPKVGEWIYCNEGQMPENVIGVNSTGCVIDTPETLVEIKKQDGTYKRQFARRVLYYDGQRFCFKWGATLKVGKGEAVERWCPIPPETLPF